MKTKLIIGTTALAVALGSFAVAQTRQPPAHSSNAKFDVYVNGQYVGSDPDLHVQLQLKLDPPSAQ